MVKIQILTRCEYCQGESYLPYTTALDPQGKQYIKHRPCPNCEGSGMAPKWIELAEFAILLKQAVCPHEHVVTQGGFHLKGGEVWDDIGEVCADCGEVLR